MFDLFKVFKKKSFKVEYTSEQSTEVSTPTPEDRLESFSKLSESLVEEMLDVNNMFKDAVLKSNKMEILSDHETSYLNSEFEKVIAYDGKGNEVLTQIAYSQPLPIENISKMYINFQFATFLSVLFDYYYNYEKNFDFQKKNSFNYLLESFVFYDVLYDQKHYETLTILNVLHDLLYEKISDDFIDYSAMLKNIRFKENTIVLDTVFYDLTKSACGYKKATIQFKQDNNQIIIWFSQKQSNGKEIHQNHILKFESSDLEEHNLLTIHHANMIFKSLSVLGRESRSLQLIPERYLCSDKNNFLKKHSIDVIRLVEQYMKAFGTPVMIEMFIQEKFSFISYLDIFTTDTNNNRNIESLYRTFFQLGEFLLKRSREYKQHTLQINEQKILKGMKAKVPDLFDISPIQKYLLEYQKITSLPRLKEAVDASDIYDLVNILMPYIERLKYVILPSIKNLIKLKLEKEEPISKGSINEDEILFSRLDSYYSSLVDEIHTIINLSKQKEISIMHDTDELVDSFISYKKQKQMFHVKQVEEEHIFNDILDNVKDLDKE